MKATSTKPTIEQFAAYQGAWEHFNRHLFDGTLKPCFLSFRPYPNSKGVFIPCLWEKDGAAAHEIALNPNLLQARDALDTMSTLVHEMVHQWQHDHGTPPRKAYHDAQWSAKMVEVGLIPTHDGTPDGRRVGQKMTHLIDPNGRYKMVFDTMPEKHLLPWLSKSMLKTPKEKEEQKKKQKVKYTCYNCVGNIWGKPDMQLACLKCARHKIERVADKKMRETLLEIIDGLDQFVARETNDD